MGEKNAEASSISAANLQEALQRGDVDASTLAGAFHNDQVEDIVTFQEAIDPEFKDDMLRRVIGERERAKSIGAAVEGGNISLMQFMQGYQDNQKDEAEALPLFVSVLEKGAGMFYIWGGQEAGKSHMATWIGDKCLKFVEDIDHIVTNIPLSSTHVDIDIKPSSDVSLYLDNEEIDKPADIGRIDREKREIRLEIDGEDVTGDLEVGDKEYGRVVKVGKETHTRKVCAAIPGRVYEAIDEWGTKGGGNKGSNPNAGEHMTRHFKEMRHRPFRSVAGIVGHSPSDLEKDARKLLDMGIHKTTPSIGRMYNRVTTKGGQDFITDVKVGAHGLDSYDDEGATRWEFDAQKDDEEDEEKDKKNEKKETAQKLRDKGMKTTEIAETIGMSQSWVSKNTQKPKST